MDILLVVLVLFLFIVLPILRALFKASDNKAHPSSRPQRRQPSQWSSSQASEPTQEPQQPSPLSADIELHSGRNPESFSTPPPAIPGTVPHPFDYQADWWRDYSRWYRDQQGWQCEECKISLYSERRYLHTHHIWGTAHNDPKDLRALCIACHAEQPGWNHHLLKEYTDYHEFMQKHRKQWEFRRSNYQKGNEQ